LFNTIFSRYVIDPSLALLVPLWLSNLTNVPTAKQVKSHFGFGYDLVRAS